MNIIQLPLGEVHPYKNNPRKNDGAVDAVAESIRQYGFLVPLVISADHEIITGHTRFKAAKKLGLSSVPCVSHKHRIKPHIGHQHMLQTQQHILRSQLLRTRTKLLRHLRRIRHAKSLLFPRNTRPNTSRQHREDAHAHRS